MKVIGCFVLLLVLSSFVLADSNVVANFVVGENDPTPDYVPSSSIWDNSLIYIILIVVILIVVYVALSKRKKSGFEKIKVKKLPVKKKRK